MKPIHRVQAYTRHSIVSLEDALAAIKAAEEVTLLHKKPPKATFNGQQVNAKSLRLRTFLHSGLKCSCCDRTGSFFALESTFQKPNPANPLAKPSFHLNLWAVDTDGDEHLMTADHIIPLSKGGPDHLSNLQTMCSECNHEKADHES